MWALTKELLSRGIDASVLIPHYGSSSSDTYEYDGITVHAYSEPSKLDKALLTGLTLPDGLVSFSQYLLKQKPDIIHFHEIAGTNGIGIAHFEAAKATGAKIVFTMHLAGNTCRTGSLVYAGKSVCNGVIDIKRCSYCSLVQKTGNPYMSRFINLVSAPFFSRKVNPIEWQNAMGTALSYPFQIQKLQENFQQVVRLADFLVPITRWYRDMLLLNGVPEKKLQLVEQGLPFEPVRSVEKKVDTSLPLKLIFLGRVDPLKGIDMLIDVVKQFDKETVTLDIYGDGPDKDFVQQCKNIASESSNISWKGRLSQEAVVGTMARYDALVLPSMFSEMSPLVIQEAFSAGIPVIGSDVYGIAEQVRNGVNGLLFKFGDRNSLKAVLEKAVTDPRAFKEFGKNSRQPRQFKAVADDYISIYAKLQQLKPVPVL